MNKLFYIKKKIDNFPPLPLVFLLFFLLFSFCPYFSLKNLKAEICAKAKNSFKIYNAKKTSFIQIKKNEIYKALRKSKDQKEIQIKHGSKKIWINKKFIKLLKLPSCSPLYVQDKKLHVLGFEIGYKNNLSNKFMDKIITDIADPSNVKNDPDPIITQTYPGNGNFISLFLEGPLWKDFYYKTSLGYNQNSFTYDEIRNPYNTDSIIILSALEKSKTNLKFSSLTLDFYLNYPIWFKSIILWLSGGISYEYYISKAQAINYRVGPNKLTELKIDVKPSNALSFKTKLEIQYKKIFLATEYNSNNEFIISGGYKMLGLF